MSSWRSTSSTGSCCAAGSTTPVRSSTVAATTSPRPSARSRRSTATKAGSSPPTAASSTSPPTVPCARSPKSHRPGTRFNDGACDPQGRFWAGTLAEDHRPGAGALFRLDRDGHVEQVLDALTISNGLGWSPDGRTMYLVDSGPRVIHAFTLRRRRGHHRRWVRAGHRPRGDRDARWHDRRRRRRPLGGDLRRRLHPPLLQ